VAEEEACRTALCLVVNANAWHSTHQMLSAMVTMMQMAHLLVLRHPK